MARGPRCGAIAVACFALAPAARAAPTLVQAQCTGIGNTTTASLAFQAQNQAGNLIVVSVDYGGTSATITSVKDVQNNVYQPASSLVTDVGQSAQTWFAANIKGGANIVTAVISGTSNGKLNIYIHEFSGAAVVGVVDATSTSSGVSSSPASGSAQTQAADELIYGHCVFGGTLTGPGSGFTQLTACNGNLTESEPGVLPASYQATFSAPSANIWAATMVTLRPASSIDGGKVSDAGANFDSGTSIDAGGNFDAGSASDGGPVGGHDGGGSPDGGPSDGGRADAALVSDGGLGGDAAPSEFTVGCGCRQSPFASWATLAMLALTAFASRRGRQSCQFQRSRVLLPVRRGPAPPQR